MPIQPLTLESLRRELAERSSFTHDHPGMFLCAMGVLSAEEAARDLAVREDSTLPMVFGEHPRHDLSRRHPLAGAVFYLPAEAGEITLGRGARSEIVVPDESVSELHCRLELSPEGTLRVVDLGSTNGSSVNQIRIEPEQPEPLADGDLLTVGRYSFQLLGAESLHELLLELAPG
jgi:hypothetical protein